MKHALVAYFSATGVTQRIANMLALAIDAKAFEIVPREIYTKLDFAHLAKIYDDAHPHAKKSENKLKNG